MRPAAALLLALPLSVLAQQPRISNAKLETRSAAAGLEQTFRAISAAQVDPVWIGFAVPVVPGHGQMCCFSSFDGGGCCAGCSLEGRNPASPSGASPGPVKLEPPSSVMILFRVEQKTVGKIRLFSPDCELDAGGLPFHWLTDVRPPESVALLSGFATAADGDSRERSRVRDSAVSAIALHADAAADRALEQFIAPGQPESLRSRTASSLGWTRGRRGFELLRKLVTEDASDKVRERAVSGLSVSKEPEAVNTIAAVARNDKSPRVRGHALSTLARKAGKAAEAAITNAIENDPETEVKRRALFALRQLPNNEGVPLLIDVARKNPNPVVRKQAMFWLGQIKDPRALSFFEELLK